MAEPLRFIRAPGRAAVLVMLALSVLAALAIAGIDRARLRRALAVGAVVLIGLEFTHVPIPLEPAPHPTRVHDYLATSPVKGAVIELPTAVPLASGLPKPGTDIREAWYTYYSTKHWRPLLNGYSGFFPPSYRRMIRTMQQFPNTVSLQLLRRRGVAFVVIHRNGLPNSPWEKLGRGFNNPQLQLVLDDGEAWLYRLV
jgi:hypothetical protein